MANQDHRSTNPFRHSDDSLPPSYSPHASTPQPRPSPSPSPQPSHPSFFDPRTTTTTPETELFISPKPKKPIFNPPPRPHDLQAANISAPSYSEHYAPPPSTAYYPPVASQDIYDPETGRMHNPYLTSGGTRRNPYMAPHREQRRWVWEYGSPCDCCSEEGWSPRLCGFRTRNMPPSQIACLLIPTVMLFVGVIVLVVVRVNARANAAD